MIDAIFNSVKFMDGDSDPRWLIINPDGKWVATTIGGNDEDNAKLITNACNLYIKNDEPVRVGCTIMIHRQGNVLLGERGEHCQTASGLYAFPGGRMDFGETPKISAIREVFEETGLVVALSNVKFLRYCNEYFPDQGKHYVSLVFIAESKEEEGEPILKEPHKCKGWEWIPIESLPKNIFEPCRDSIMMGADEALGIK